MTSETPFPLEYPKGPPFFSRNYYTYPCDNSIIHTRQDVRHHYPPQILLPVHRAANDRLPGTQLAAMIFALIVARFVLRI